MVDIDIVYHLVAFGFSDVDERVAMIARRAFLELTTLDLEDCVAPPLATVLRAVFPLLQCHVADAVVGRRITLLISNAMMDPQVPPAETFAVGLRALLQTDAGARRWGRDKLMRHIQLAPCPRFDEDMLLGAARSGRRDATRLAQSAVGWANHKEADALQLLEVFANLKLSLHLRLAAAEHLGLVLHHKAFHATLLQRGLFPLVANTIRDARSSRDTTDTLDASSRQLADSLVRACVTIVRLLVHNDNHLRHHVVTSPGADGLLVSCLQHVLSAETVDSRLLGEFAVLVTQCVFDEAIFRSAPTPPQRGDQYADRVAVAGRPDETALRDEFVPDGDDAGLAHLFPGQPALRLPRCCALAFELPVESIVGTFQTQFHIASPALHPMFVPAVHEMWFITCISTTMRSNQHKKGRAVHGISSDAGSLRADVERYKIRYPHLMPADEAVELLQTLDTSAQLGAALLRMQNAADHDTVAEALATIEVYCIDSDLGLSEFVQLQWHVVFSRYVTTPASGLDAALQTRLLTFCRVVALSNHATAVDLGWLTEVTTSKLLDRLNLQPTEDVSWHVQQELLAAILDLTEALLANPRNQAMTQHVIFTCVTLLIPTFTTLESQQSQFDVRVFTRILRMLVHLTGPAGYQCQGFTQAQLEAIASEVTRVTVASAANGESFTDDTFFGSNTTDLAITAARQIADALMALERQDREGHDDIQAVCWLFDDTIEWVEGLCIHLSDLVRVQALGLTSAFLRSTALRARALELQLPVRQGVLPLVEALISIVYDLEESVVVRAAAVRTLVTLEAGAKHQTSGDGTDLAAHGRPAADFFEEIQKHGLLPKIGWVLESAAGSDDLVEPLYILLHNLLLAHTTVVLNEMSQAGAWTILARHVADLRERHGSCDTDRSWCSMSHRLFALLALAIRVDTDSGGEHNVAATLIANVDLLPTVAETLATCYHATMVGADEVVVAAFTRELCDFLTRLTRGPADIATRVLDYASSNWAVLLVPLDTHLAGPTLPATDGWDLWQPYGIFLLALLERCDARQVPQLTPSLDEASTSAESSSTQVFSGEPSTKTIGELMCDRLLPVYMNSLGDGHGCEVIGIDVLAALLAVSDTAKRYAIRMGLLDTIVKDMNEVHATLCMEGLNTTDSWGPGASASKASLSSPNIRLSGSLKLLANVLHKSLPAKQLAVRRGIVAVLEPLWGLCILTDRTTRLMLEVLCNLVAECPNAARSLALPFSNRQSLVVATCQLGIKLLCNRARASLHTLTFDLITTFAATAECRNVLWKEGLLEECITRLPVAKQLQPDIFRFFAVASLYVPTLVALDSTCTRAFGSLVSV
jgi:hypothetical protein